MCEGCRFRTICKDYAKIMLFMQIMQNLCKMYFFYPRNPLYINNLQQKSRFCIKKVMKKFARFKKPPYLCGTQCDKKRVALVLWHFEQRQKRAPYLAIWYKLLRGCKRLKFAVYWCIGYPNRIGEKITKCDIQKRAIYRHIAHNAHDIGKGQQPRYITIGKTQTTRKNVYSAHLDCVVLKAQPITNISRELYRVKYSK